MILAALTNILQTQGIENVYPVIIPQGIDLPASKMFVVGDKPNPAKKETSQINETLVQISSYARTYKECVQQNQAIKTALDGYNATDSETGLKLSIDYDDSRDLYEDSPNEFGKATDYKILIK